MTRMLHQFQRKIASGTDWRRDLRPAVLVLRGGHSILRGSAMTIMALAFQAAERIVAAAIAVKF